MDWLQSLLGSSDDDEDGAELENPFRRCCEQILHPSRQEVLTRALTSLAVDPDLVLRQPPFLIATLASSLPSLESLQISAPTSDPSKKTVLDLRISRNLAGVVSVRVTSTSLVKTLTAWLECESTLLGRALTGDHRVLFEAEPDFVPAFTLDGFFPSLSSPSKPLQIPPSSRAPLTRPLPARPFIRLEI